MTVKVYKSLLTGEEFSVSLKDRDPLARQEESGVEEKLSTIARDFSEGTKITQAQERGPDLFDLFSPESKVLLEDIQWMIDEGIMGASTVDPSIGKKRK
jgi:hypothetical protein